jgi:hypothetical protein
MKAKVISSPADRPIDGPDPVLNALWNERVRLRAEQARASAAVAKLDSFITDYLKHHKGEGNG